MSGGAAVQPRLSRCAPRPDHQVRTLFGRGGLSVRIPKDTSTRFHEAGVPLRPSAVSLPAGIGVLYERSRGDDTGSRLPVRERPIYLPFPARAWSPSRFRQAALATEQHL